MWLHLRILDILNHWFDLNLEWPLLFVQRTLILKEKRRIVLLKLIEDVDIKDITCATIKYE